MFLDISFTPLFVQFEFMPSSSFITSNLKNYFQVASRKNLSLLVYERCLIFLSGGTSEIAFFCSLKDICFCISLSFFLSLGGFITHRDLHRSGGARKTYCVPLAHDAQGMRLVRYMFPPLHKLA